jgi:hypothetical protein
MKYEDLINIVCILMCTIFDEVPGFNKYCALPDASSNENN